MALGINITVTRSGDLAMFPRTADRLRKPRKFLAAVGVQLMSSAVRRLPGVLSTSDDAVRTGRLAASLRVNASGGGSANTIFRLTDRSVTVGSNLPYAAQVHYGGTIYPNQADALAIPLVPQLKRQDISPSQHPEKERIFFRRHEGGKPNVFGLLFLAPKSKRGKPRLLYALAYLVQQRARPFLYADDNDKRTIAEEIFPKFLAP
ncbi:MAG: hypothetical protein J5J06_05605 [Phycisphaerae bacterium]|nr:hypothetical protein [Phycisphaerae bacterium]